MKRSCCLKRRWRGLCAACGVTRGDPEEAFEDLDRRYRAPGRHYHTWAHVAACLRELDRLRPPREPPEALALELALWFHDAVYDPGAGDNEEASARLAARWGDALGLEQGLLQAAAGLILATRHGSPEPRGAPVSPGAAAGWPEAEAAGAGDRPGTQGLIRDIDLAILGSCPWRYRCYARGIRKEYARMSGEAFRRGRIALLQGLLQRGEIYATPPFRRRYEKRARRNLKREMGRLGRGTRPKSV